MHKSYEVKSNSFHEVRLYIGTVRGYGDSFCKNDVIQKISEFQTNWNSEYGFTIALRLLDTTFIAMDYRENGYEITAIRYPRFVRSVDEINKFMRELAVFLLEVFEQNRICVIFTGDYNMIEMYESCEAEINNK